MKCPRCQESHAVIKSGFQKNCQRYHCKNCRCYFTEETLERLSVAKKFRAQAKKLYLEGHGFRAIGRALGVSNVSVLRWIRASDVKKPLNAVNEAPEGTELHETRHDQGDKKTSDGFGSP